MQTGLPADCRRHLYGYYDQANMVGRTRSIPIRTKPPSRGLRARRKKPTNFRYVRGLAAVVCVEHVGSLGRELRRSWTEMRAMEKRSESWRKRRLKARRFDFPKNRQEAARILRIWPTRRASTTDYHMHPRPAR